MSRIPPEDLDSIRTRIPIEEVIGEHVALKAGGSSMKGLCPFHQEKTPSFNVNRTSNTFHCFGCGESGDVIDFIQKIEGEGFRWAVTYLSEQHNIPISFSDEEDQSNRTKKSRLVEANTIAAEAFAYALRKTPEAEPARDFLTNRGFDYENAAHRFGCGYAPREQSLVKLLATKGFSTEEIIESGLGIESADRPGHIFDRFQGRLTWTIRDSFGKPIGFGARKLSETDPISSKFINTSATTIYKKSSVLFALDLARKEITRTRQAIVVEGYTDVLAFHLAGRTNSVAPCGTAFTSEHLHILRRLVGPSGEIVFGFDDDDAGQKAAQAAYKEANSTLRRLSALPRTNGLDPDDYRQEHGEVALAALLDRRLPLSEAIITMVIEQMPTETPEDRIAALDAVIPYLNDITDPLVRNEYAAKVGTLLRFDPKQIEARLTTKQTPQQDAPAGAGQSKHLPPEWVEKELLQVLAQKRAMAEQYTSDWDFDLKFSKQASLQTLEVIRRALADPNTDHVVWPLLLKQVCQTEQETKIITSLIANDLPVDHEAVSGYATELLSRLGRQENKRTIDALKEKISSALNSDDKQAALAQLMAHQKKSLRS